jgi:putative selenium metabolism hydrolase
MKETILERLKSNEQEMFTLLSNMVKIPSVSGNEAAMAEYVNDYCLKLDFDSHIDRHGNVIAIVKGKQPGKRIAFNSHLDTVAIGDGWTGNPLSGEIIGDKMYGRGSTDCKASIAAQIISAKSLVEAGADFAGEIALSYPVGEEVQNISRKGTLKMLQDGFTADMAINGECTDLHVCLACGGMLEVKVTTIGVGAHGATPFKGKNAIRMMCKVIPEIDKLVPGYNKYTGRGSINLGVISGGERSSVVPDRCELKVSRFTVSGETGPMFYAQILGIIERLKLEDPNFSAIAELTYDSNPSVVGENEQVVKSIVNAHTALGMDCPLTGSPQHDDADFLTNTGHIPTVIYGPGSSLMAHMPDEYVLLEEVITAAKVYALTVYDALKI